MSLSRLALRLAAIEALNPSATVASGPWPTIARNRVYDSRIDPIAAAATIDALSAAVAALESQPIITVYTEEQETTPVAGDYWADVEIVDLLIQMQIGARGEIDVTAADGATATFGASSQPATDGDAESLIDTLEGQVLNLLDINFIAPSNALFRSVARECHHIGSTPGRDGERAVRLAQRTVKMKFRVPRTQWPPYAVVPAPTGLAVLPPPLGAVAAALAPGSAAAMRCAKIAGLITPPVPLVPLTDIRLLTNLDRAQAPTDPAGADSDAIADVPGLGPPAPAAPQS